MPPRESRAAASVTAAVVVAFCVFAVWQLVYHWLFMRLIPLPMVASHLVALLVETVGAVLLTAYFLRVLRRQNAELRALDAQKSMLVDMLVHDLRQPLTAVMGSLAAAAEPGVPPELGRRFVGVAQQGSAQLLQMVNDLLDVTRLEAGHGLTNAEPIHPSEFIQHAVSVLEACSEEYGISLVTETDAELPAIAGDGERLSRVITNLVGNALRCTERGGSITVKAELGPDPRFVLISVSDTGRGIPREAQRRIFDKFGGVEKSALAGRNSTGLGLYFCRMVVEAHGGTIGVESEPDKGATFSFALPVVCPPVPEA